MDRQEGSSSGTNLRIDGTKEETPQSIAGEEYKQEDRSVYKDEPILRRDWTLGCDPTFWKVSRPTGQS
jgi:hypothetical protein